MLKHIKLVRIFQVPTFSYNIRKPAPALTEQEKERRAYKKVMNQYRSNLVKNYWEEQQQIENQYIETYLEKERLQAKRVEKFRRSQIVFQTFIGTQQYEKQQIGLKAREERVRKYFIEQDIKKMNREQILKMLTQESQQWFNLENLESNLVSDLILPDTVTNQISYYYHLQEQAVLFESGNYEELDKMFNSSQPIEWKNRMAMPLYQRIIGLIKFLKQDNILFKLEQEWETCRAILLSDQSLDDTDRSQQLSNLDYAFATLIKSKIDELESNPVLKLKEINQQLLRLYNLLVLWEKYVSIIKMDYSTTKALIQAEKQKLNLFQQTSAQTINQVKPSNLLNQKDDKDDAHSADEKHTSSDEEIDISKMVSEQSRKQTQDAEDHEHNKATLRDNSESQEDSEFNQTILNLLQEADDKSVGVQSQFEEQYAKDSTAKVYYNEYLTQNNMRDSRSVFEGVDLTTIFPQSLLQQKLSHLALDFNSVQDIKTQHDKMQQLYSLSKEESNLVDDPNLKKLNALAVTEVFKQQLQSIEIPPEYQTLLNETRILLDAVSEIKIDDAHFLIQLWNYSK